MEDPRWAEIGSVVFAGYLTKQGRRLRSWKRRHFEIDSAGWLKYYRLGSSTSLVRCV